MRTRTKSAIAALITTATLALAITATCATARNFRTSEREFEVLTRELAYRTSSNTIICPTTLLGRFVESTIPKIIGTQIGAIRHVAPLFGGEPPCTGATITILNATLPWLIYYQGFTGTLPSITAIRLSISGVAFRVRTPGGVGCLTGTTARNPAFSEVLVGAGGRVEGLRADENARIPLGGGFLCSLAGESTFSGTGSVLDLPGRNAITITLI